MLSHINNFLIQHKEYAPVAFFGGGFIWDSLTLGRIDALYSNVILLTYLIALTISVYIFNLADDNRWENTFLTSAEQYTPYAIQFFLGGLSSAYVIFFFQSVSMTKTIVFFAILVLLLVSNEVFKHRISNRYLQLGAYYFVNFTFFIFFLPVLLGSMNTFIFILSGFISLAITYYFIRFILDKSPSTRKEISQPWLIALILGIYLLINSCYYFNLIPPVPLSLKTGLVAYDVQKKDNSFIVTYDKPLISILGRDYNSSISISRGDTVYVYTSIFAPGNLTKSVLHRWNYYDSRSDSWNTTDEINYKVKGGRQRGYRGYTYKINVRPGRWRVDVVTQEGLVLGRIDFEIVDDGPKSMEDLTSVAFD